MQLNSKKELTPVVFGETSVKILKTKLGPHLSAVLIGRANVAQTH